MPPPHRRFVTWLRTADAEVPRAVRSARRWIARTAARRRHGSITAHMEAVVEEANRATSGAGFPDHHRPRPRTPK